jgi:hypothetical protein
MKDGNGGRDRTITTDLDLPAADDIAFYAEHGWWTSGHIVPEDVLDAAQLGAERYYAGGRDHQLLITGGYLDWRPEQGNVVRLNDYVSLQNDELRQMIALPVLARTAGTPAGPRSSTSMINYWC